MGARLKFIPGVGPFPPSPFFFFSSFFFLKQLYNFFPFQTCHFAREQGSLISVWFLSGQSAHAWDGSARFLATHTFCSKLLLPSSLNHSLSVFLLHNHPNHFLPTSRRSILLRNEGNQRLAFRLNERNPRCCFFSLGKKPP